MFHYQHSCMEINELMSLNYKVHIFDLSVNLFVHPLFLYLSVYNFTLLNTFNTTRQVINGRS